MFGMLKVEGRSVVLREPVVYSRRSGRRMYDAELFTCEETHEIANHYKDFKRKKKLRKRRRKSSVKGIREFNESLNYREVLQIPCFIFPRKFPEVFPWRGRQTICALEPPDQLYNPSVRRIRAATSLSELKFLVNRQNRLYNNNSNNGSRSVRSNIKNPIRPSTKANEWVKISNILEPNPILHSPRETRNIAELDVTREAENCTLGYVKRLDTTRHCHHITFDVTKAPERSTYPISAYGDDYLIELASECYDEGFQSHLNYLQSIGERNSLKRNRKESACSASSSLSSASVESGTKLFGTVKRVVNLKRPTGKRGRRIPLSINSFDEDIITPEECQIRVKITRPGSPSNQGIPVSRYPNHREIFSRKRADHHLDSKDSMSDFLSLNDSLLASNGSQSINGIDFNTVKNGNVGELVDSLSSLQINEFSNLPKIILTDFSSSQETTGTSTTPSSDIGTKQLNIEYSDFDSCLNIPSEKNYRSEARPP